jgi:hypothetical protein
MIGYYPINPAGGSVDEDAFGAKFFRTHFYDRMKQVCEVDDSTPVLEIVLTSGQVVDVSHIIELKNDHMLICAFVDNHDCENTYNTYLRYITIYRINVLSRPRAERPIGFNNREPQFNAAPHKPKVPARVGPKHTGKKKK